MAETLFCTTCNKYGVTDRNDSVAVGPVALGQVPGGLVHGVACAALGSQQSTVVGPSARWGRVRYVLGMVPCSPGLCSRWTAPLQIKC